MKRVFVTFVVVAALASYAFAPQTAVLAFQESPYLNCGAPPGPGPVPERPLTPDDLTKMCKTFHPDAVGTGYCLGKDCFNRNAGQYITVAAKGKPGDFPRTWHAWLEQGALNVTKYDCGWDKCDQCEIPGQSEGKAVEIKLRDGNKHPNRCKAEREVGEYLFHEHFASNSTTKCLIWMECRENLKKAP